MGDLIDGLVREHARTAALQLQLDLLPAFYLLLGLGLGLSFPLHPRGVFTAGSLFGVPCRYMLRCLVRAA